MKSNKRMILFYLFFIVAIVVAATAFSNSGNTKKVKYSDIFTTKRSRKLL